MKLLVPTLIALPADGGPPEVGTQLQPTSRVPNQVRDYGAFRVKLHAADGSTEMYGPQFFVAVVDLITDVEGGDAHTAARSFSPTLELILDLLSFEMGSVIRIGQADLVDITPQAALGDTRSSSTFTSGLLDNDVRQVEMQAVDGMLYGQLPDISAICDSRAAAALRWFIKALGTDLLHDQFIFLWIALEILSDDSAIAVEAPYTANCQHEIPLCPDCGASTSRKVLGLSRKAFLIHLGVSDGEARGLWQMRQLMHGAISFDSRKLDQLPALLQVLRAAVTVGLKTRLGLSKEAPPHVASSGLSIRPGASASGRRTITVDDIAPL